MSEYVCEALANGSGFRGTLRNPDLLGPYEGWHKHDPNKLSVTTRTRGGL